MLKPPDRFDDTHDGTQVVASGTEKRRDIWPSREEALAYFRSKAAYQAWHPRAVELYVVRLLNRAQTL